MRRILRKVVVFILTLEARLALWKYKPKIIAITGSAGKTSAKDAIFAVLSSSFSARESEKSYNSEIGLPLTILGCENAWNNPLIWLKNVFKGLRLILFPSIYPAWLILEVGVRKPGDMQKIISWLSADVAVFTYFGATPSHIEFFDSIEELIEEKSQLLKALKSDGLLFLDADDPKVMELKGRVGNKTIAFGSYFYSDVEFNYHNGRPIGMNFKMNYQGKSAPAKLEGCLGPGHLQAAAAAVAVALNLGIDFSEAVKNLERYRAPAGRMKLLPGIKKTLIIDDSYNSSPAAAEAAVRVLGQIRLSGRTENASFGRKIAVLGDMLELGKYTDEAHGNLGRLAASQADILITVGPRSEYTVEGALNGGMSERNIFQFENSRKAGKFAEQIIDEGDVILVKGSQGMRMERAVAEIMAHPEDKEKLLVRQEPEWIRRNNG